MIQRYSPLPILVNTEWENLEKSSRNKKRNEARKLEGQIILNVATISRIQEKLSTKHLVFKRFQLNWVHTCTPSYLGGCDQENYGLKTAQADSSRDPISKITTEKWTGGVDQVAKHLLCKYKALSSNPSTTKKKKKKKSL
jgi:hypothetical protein